MQFISFRVLSRRIKAISSMMKDKTVPKRKKLLIVLGIEAIEAHIDSNQVIGVDASAL